MLYSERESRVGTDAAQQTSKCSFQSFAVSEPMLSPLLYQIHVALQTSFPHVESSITKARYGVGLRTFGHKPGGGAGKLSPITSFITYIKISLVDMIIQIRQLQGGLECHGQLTVVRCGWSGERCRSAEERGVVAHSRLWTATATNCSYTVNTVTWYIVKASSVKQQS